MADAPIQGLAEGLGPLIEQVIKDARPILKQGKKLAKQAAKGPSDPSAGKHKKSHRLRNVVLLAAGAGAAVVGVRKTQG